MPSPIQKRLDDLTLLASSPPSPESLVKLRTFLRDRESFLVEKAIRLAEKWAAPELVPDLISTFNRLLTSKDSGAAAKTAIAEILCNWMSPQASALFETATRHIQREPVWGGQVDVAGPLRGWGAFGLAALGHHDQVRLILPLLIDPQPEPRIYAARALSVGRSPAGEALLRLKVLQGDPEPDVLADILLSLATGWPENSLDFFLSLVEKNPAPAELLPALLAAIAHCKTPRAVATLRDLYHNDLSPTSRRQTLDALALCRRSEAADFLLCLLTDSSPSQALATLSALNHRRGDPTLWPKVVAAILTRNDPQLTHALHNPE